MDSHRLSDQQVKVVIHMLELMFQIKAEEHQSEMDNKNRPYLVVNKALVNHLFQTWPIILSKLTMTRCKVKKIGKKLQISQVQPHNAKMIRAQFLRKLVLLKVEFQDKRCLILAITTKKEILSKTNCTLFKEVIWIQTTKFLSNPKNKKWTWAKEKAHHNIILLGAVKQPMEVMEVNLKEDRVIIRIALLRTIRCPKAHIIRKLETLKGVAK